MKIMGFATGLFFSILSTGCQNEPAPAPTPQAPPPAVPASLPVAPPTPAAPPTAATTPAAPPPTPLIPMGYMESRTASRSASAGRSTPKNESGTPPPEKGPQQPPNLGALLGGDNGAVVGTPGDAMDGRLIGVRGPGTEGGSATIGTNPSTGAPPSTGKAPSAGADKPVRGQLKMKRSVKISGNLQGAVVDKVLRKRAKALKACYDLALRADPTLEGDLTMRFTISAKGRVPEAETTQNEVNQAVGKCFIARYKRFSFPASDGDSVFEKRYKLIPKE